MLLGFVKLDEVYEKPTGPTLVSNIISEIVVGNAYTLAALVGSALLLFRPQDVSETQPLAAELAPRQP